MKPLVTFADPERKVIDFYDGLALADSVSSAFPTSTLAGTATHMQVELEVGNTAAYPASERAQVRVTCHVAPGRRSTVKDLASLAQGHLLAWGGDADVSGTFPLVGRSDVITDDATQNLMVWFTARVDLKATQLAS